MKLKSKNLKLLEPLPLIHVQYLAKHKTPNALRTTSDDSRTMFFLDGLQAVFV